MRCFVNTKSSFKARYFRLETGKPCQQACENVETTAILGQMPSTRTGRLPRTGRRDLPERDGLATLL